MLLSYLMFSNRSIHKFDSKTYMKKNHIMFTITSIQNLRYTVERVNNNLKFIKARNRCYLRSEENSNV